MKTYGFSKMDLSRKFLWIKTYDIAKFTWIPECRLLLAEFPSPKITVADNYARPFFIQGRTKKLKFISVADQREARRRRDIALKFLRDSIYWGRGAYGFYNEEMDIFVYLFVN
jgi:hypothetical protein